MQRVSIALKEARSITVFLSDEETQHLLEQFYEVCSGELEDNVIEVITNANGYETTLIKGDEIMYIQSMEEHDV